VRARSTRDARETRDERATSSEPGGRRARAGAILAWSLSLVLNL